MRILHVNIRASQGGAGRVALDLHRRLIKHEIDSRLVYGYGSGIKDDPNVANDLTIGRIGTRPAVIGNYLGHRIFGLDLFTGRRQFLIDEISASDVVHLHCPHHYYLNWDIFIEDVIRTGRPVVATAHDWWFVTGRCGFVEQCTGWQRDCGECGAMKRRDLPSVFDLSRFHRARKVASIKKLGKQIRFACPSAHLARDYQSVFPDTDIQVIPNCVDLEFEETFVAHVPDMAGRNRCLFSATDLSSPGKIDVDLVKSLISAGDVALRFVGRCNPFGGDSETSLGEIRDRHRMAELLRTSQALVFCSRMDNAPLTIMEALVSGCYVLAYPSPAAKEILELVGGSCVSDRVSMISLIRNGNPAVLYGGVSPGELAARARARFSGSAMTTSYLNLYKQAVSSEFGTPSDQPGRSGLGSKR